LARVPLRAALLGLAVALSFCSRLWQPKQEAEKQAQQPYGDNSKV
jgi:hypothetical protein